jgi:hypothetical protein
MDGNDAGGNTMTRPAILYGPGVRTVPQLRRANARAERVRGGVATVLTAMSRGADHRVQGVSDALFKGIPS